VEALTYKNDRQRAGLTFEHHISIPVLTVFPQLPLADDNQGCSGKVARSIYVKNVSMRRQGKSVTRHSVTDLAA
jgi:hypothetical protein